MFEFLSIIVKILVVLIVMKSLIIGSDFSFYYWLKYGKKYREWYSRRSKYEDYRKTVRKEKRR